MQTHINSTQDGRQLALRYPSSERVANAAHDVAPVADLFPDEDEPQPRTSLSMAIWATAEREEAHPYDISGDAVSSLDLLSLDRVSVPREITSSTPFRSNPRLSWSIARTQVAVETVWSDSTDSG
ncbi:hypothetical protein ACA910_022754 [Epithemia clementina (nom. ined.)]